MEALLTYLDCTMKPFDVSVIVVDLYHIIVV